MKRSTRLAAASGLALLIAATTAGVTSATSEPVDSSAVPTVELPDLTGEELILYSGRNEQLVQPIIDEFEAATGAVVKVRYGSSAEVGAALLEEGDRTPADVFFSQEVGALGALAKEGLLAPLSEESVARVDERFRPNEGTDWVGVTGRSRVIVYNPELVENPPSGVLELTDPQYEGMTAWVPGNAGFQAFITGFRTQSGDEAVLEWIEAMQANGVQTYEGNGDVLEAVNNGDLPMGLINHYYWARMLNEVGAENMTAQLIFPAGDDPGGLVNATAVGILNGGADNPASQAFVDFLVSDFGQQYFVETTAEYPVVPGIADPAGLPALDELEGPQLDLTDLDSLIATQELLTEAGLLS